MISIILVVLAGIFNACMDVLYYRWKICIFNKCNENWFNPNKSYINKWKNVNGIRKERFLGSSTVFVFLTDFWHLLKFLMILAFAFAIIFYHPITQYWWLDLIILYCSFTIPFEIFFSKILVSKKNI